MPAGHYDFRGDAGVVRRGETFARRLTRRLRNPDGTPGAPIDLTGYAGRMQVRDRPGGTVLLDLSTGNGGMTLGGAAGTIDLLASAAATAALTPGDYVYDLRLTSGSGVATYALAGSFEVIASVTE